MKLQELEYFLKAVQCGSFTKAAEQAYTSQSSISKAIASLEQELRYPLFVRTNHGSVPTREAAVLAGRLESALAELESALAGPEGDRPSDGAVLRVALTVNMTMKKILPAFRSFFPYDAVSRDRVVFQCLPVGEVVRRVLDGDVDLGFVYSVENLNFPDLNKLVITSQVPRIYYARGMFEKDDRDVSLEDFLNVTFVFPGECEYVNYDRMLDLPSPGTPVVYANLGDINAYVRSGLYATILGCSQILQDDPAVATLVHRTSVQRAGMDAVWRAGNQNPLLRRVLTSLTAVI